MATIAILTLVSLARAAQVCSPSACLPGRSSSEVLAFDASTGTWLTPGTYYNLSLPKSPLELEVTSGGSYTTVHAPSEPITFAAANYSSAAATHNTAAPEWWESAFLPQGSYALLAPGKALWGAVPDRKQLPHGDYKVVSFNSALCDPPCSHGTCSTNTGNATCNCEPGWTGAACDTCAPGFHGSRCEPCPANCTVCDDGLQGSGTCLAPAPRDCNCAHGTCTPSSQCYCAAGWVTAPKVSAKACDICAEGFYLSADGDCLACPYGCLSCTLAEGASAPSCTACSPTMFLTSAVPATCLANSQCGVGTYFDSASSTCLPCSPACETCSGPTPADCIACSSGRAELQNECVHFDFQTGVCESQYSSLLGVFVVDAEKRKCDACPVGCQQCYIPAFQGFQPYSSLVCTTCQDGYMLANGTCVKQCAEGSFMSSAVAANGTCSACDISCKTCAGTSTHCTSCASGLAYNGTCVSTCPSNTVAGNATCLLCHPDCATCSSPGADKCLTCPSSRPVMQNGRCAPVCPSTAYFDTASSTCVRCDTSCASCLAAGSSSCTGCAGNAVLQGGSCLPTNCTMAPGLGVCLSAFVTKPPQKATKNLAPLAVIPALLIVALFVALVIRREHRKTREATADFARQLDEQGARRRMALFDLDFWRTTFKRKPIERSDEENHGVSGLRELRLQPGRRGTIPSVVASLASPPPYDARSVSPMPEKTPSALRLSVPVSPGLRPPPRAPTVESWTPPRPAGVVLDERTQGELYDLRPAMGGRRGEGWV